MCAKKGHQQPKGIDSKIYKHGYALSNNKSRLYRIWCHILSRTGNPNYTYYSCYGGRGITIYNEWKKFIPFMEWSIANGYAENLEIDRINNNGNYCPENCRWTTHIENCLNRRKRENWGIYPNGNSFYCVITRNNKRHYIGSSSNIQEIIEMRDNFINVLIPIP